MRLLIRNIKQAKEMKIVILESYAAQPGDLDWSEVHTLGTCQIYDHTTEEQVVERCKDAEVILSSKTPLRAPILKQLGQLKYIGLMTTGYNLVDVAFALEQGIIVTNLPAYSASSVAQMVFALLLHIAMPIDQYNEGIHGGQWRRYDGWPLRQANYLELSGLSIGIVGMGKIGAAVAHIAHGFGMHVLTSSSKPAEQLPPFSEKVTLHELFERADVISLHCPLVPETKGLVDAKLLALVKPSAILINTARGELIDEDALATALAEGRLAAAGLDVQAQEPPAPDSPLLPLTNCILTPHVGWATKAACRRLNQSTINNLRAFLSGNPINVIN